MKIGFIGLGIMGKPMVKNLLKAGYDLYTYDISNEAIMQVVEYGAKACASPKEVAEQCKYIILMVPNGPQVREVVLDVNGVIHGAASHSIVIDMSSIAPVVSQEISQKLKEKEIDMLDAPVSGGEPKAIDGTLSIMVGGKKEIFEECYEIFMKVGSSAVLCGDIGAGNTTKLANQIIVALNIAAVSEALVLGSKAGVDPEAIYQAIRGGLAGSVVLDAKAPMMIEGNYKPGFKIDLHYKDLSNALDTARQMGAPMLLTNQVYEIMKTLRNDGKGQNDHSGIVEFYEELAKKNLKSK